MMPPAAPVTAEQQLAPEDAERRYLEHAAACSGCRAMLRRCPTAEVLWRMRLAAKRAST